MSEDVKGRRRYDSRSRHEQARRNRLAVLDAARRHFLDRGYAATTLAAVAGDAGVSVETVYKAFANKAGLLKAVFDVAVAGDDEPVPLAERDFVREINAEPDPVQKLRLYGEHLARTGPRIVALQLLVRDAAASDPAAGAVWQQMLTERLSGMGMLAAHLHEGGHLRPDVSVDEARDVLWAYVSPELHDLLVVQRGWPASRFGRWVADALASALLR
jgi:AcrR family transcriptional regulator